MISASDAFCWLDLFAFCRLDHFAFCRLDHFAFDSWPAFAHLQLGQVLWRQNRLQLLFDALDLGGEIVELSLSSAQLLLEICLGRGRSIELALQVGHLGGKRLDLSVHIADGFGGRRRRGQLLVERLDLDVQILECPVLVLQIGLHGHLVAGQRFDLLVQGRDLSGSLRPTPWTFACLARRQPQPLW